MLDKTSNQNAVNKSNMDMSVTSILSTLQSKTASTEERTEAYQHFSNNLKEEDVSLFSLDVCTHATKFLAVLEKDIQDDALSQAALQVLGFFLHDNEIVRKLTSGELTSVISVLCQCVLKTEEKTTCTRALWCLSKQVASADIVSKSMPSMKSALEHSVTKWRAQSVTVENETFNVIARLLDQCPKEMKQEVLWWGKMLMPLLVHSAIKVREKALQLVQSELSTLMTQQMELAKHLEVDFNKKYAEELRKLFISKNESHVINCWSLLVQLFGECLHQGSNLINSLLSVVELGFKSAHPETKCITFQAWQQLIDNFAQKPGILTDPRRVKLIMQVFKVNNAKVESVAKVKVQVWWHFVWLLGNKVTTFFDTVCVPLLNFCIGGSKSQNPASTPRGLKNGTSPATPQMNLNTMTPKGSPAPVFSSLQCTGCEILAHILGNIPGDIDVPAPRYNLDPLSYDVITGPGFFIKHAQLFIRAISDIICGLGEDIPEKLLHQVWLSLVAHMKNALEHLKSEMREILCGFLTQFQVIVLSQALDHRTVVKMFEAVCCLPKKSLCSTAYNITNGERIHGTPALFLMELLLTPMLLKESCMLPSYMVLVNKLVECGMGNVTGSLEFCQATLKMLSQNVEFVSDKETVWRLWSCVVNPLHEQIKNTNEVNQGDALEHNFSCMYWILMFPIEQRLPSHIPRPSVKTLLKTWCDVYKTFARLTALVANAEANICCEELCQRLNKVVNSENIQDLLFLDFMVNMCLTMMNCVDFSSIGMQTAFNLSNLSPAKWTKRKQKPMDNLQSMVTLVTSLLGCVTKAASGELNLKKTSNMSLQSPATSMVELLTVLFTHVTTSSVISTMIGHLSEPISELYIGSAAKSSGNIYNNGFMQKLEKLWLDICTCIQSRLTDPMDSEMLQKLSPLLEATFLHPRRGVKHQTVLFWKSAFANASTLNYPESLKPVLAKVKEKNPLPLPGWKYLSIPVIEETPVSQLSQSQAPEPHIPGMPSPGRIHGSFLNKAISPNIKKSPAKPVTVTSGKESAKKNILSMYEYKNNDFVVIKSPVKKKRVLTDHQKEVFKDKKVIPTMYNTLDVSQDVSMMASQFSTDTQTQPETPLPFTDSVVIIGSSASKSSEQSQPTQEPSQTLLKITDKKVEESPAVVREKVTRRRSVRFKDTSKDKDSEPVLHSPTESISSKSIEHFSIIKETLSQQEKDVIVISSDSQKDQTLSSSGAGNSTISSSAPTQDDGIPQNVLGAMSVFDQLGSKSLSLESKKSESSPKESLSLSEDKVDIKEAEKNESQPLLSWSNQLKSLSSSPLQKDLSLTACSESSLPKEESQSQGSHRDFNGLLKSSPEETDALSRSGKDDLPKSVAIVEETQSPKKLLAKGLSSSLEHMEVDVIPPIMETPPRPDIQENSKEGRLSNKKLFPSDESQKHAKDINKDSNLLMVEDSNIIPASPQSLKTNNSLIRSTPVLKIKRLTDNEIKHFSPVKPLPLDNSQVSQNQTPSKASASKSLLNQENSKESLGASHDSSDSKGTVHEHDDFSEIRPLESEDIIPSSQGFVPDNSTGSNVAPSCFVKFNNKSVSEAANIVQEKGVDKQDKKDSSSQQGGDKHEASEKLFDDDEDLYDPDLDSTYKDMADIAPAKLCNQTNLQESQVSETGSSDGSQSQKTDVPDKTNSLSPQEYDPKISSTLASETETPRRGRKRKQDTPKKLSPDSKKPRRGRSTKISDKTKTPNKNSSKNSCNETANKTPNGKKCAYNGSQSPEDDSITVCSVQEKDDLSQTPRGSRSRGKHTMLPSSDRKLRENKGEKVISSSQDVTVVEVHRRFDEPKIDSFFFKKDVNCNSIVKEGLDFLEDKMNSEAELLGQKTPETRIEQTIPQRKSTTKKKMKVAQKRSQNKEKRVVVNTGDSNLDSDSSEDDVSLLDLALLREAEKMEEEALAQDSRKNIEMLSKDSQKDSEMSQNSEKNIEMSSQDNVVSGKTKGALNNSEVSASFAEKTDNNNQKLSEEKTEETRKLEGGNSTSKSDSQLTGENKQNSEEVVDLTLSQSQKEKSTRGKTMKEKTSLRLRSSELSLRSGKSRTRDKSLKLKKSTKISEGKANKTEHRIHENGELEESDQVTSDKSKRDRKQKKGQKKKTETKRCEADKTIEDESKDDNEMCTEGSEQAMDSPLSNVSQQTMDTQPSHVSQQAMDTQLSNVSQQTMDTQPSDVSQQAMNTELNNVSQPAMDSRPSDIDKNNTKIDGDECDKQISCAENENVGKVTVDNNVDETPRKVPDIEPSAFTLFEHHTDSKLVTVSRKFDRKRHVIARRSILKSSTTQGRTLRSPSSKPFHPIRVGHIYSPAASPSAGILKRRRLSGDKATNSPSPPNKQRRVSFSQPLTYEKVNGEAVEDGQKEVRPHSPLVTNSSKVSSSLEKFYTTPGSSESQALTDSDKKDSQLSETQNSYKSTQESQLNTTQPIFPELVECGIKVDRVLPQLTSSIWMRGLGQLVRARNIHTIGDLSSLTEREIDSLPIRSPKVSTVRSVLRRLENQEEAKRNKNAKVDMPVSSGTVQDTVDGDINSSVADVMTSSSDLLEQIDIIVDKNQTDVPASSTSQNRVLADSAPGNENSPLPLEEGAGDTSVSLFQTLDTLTTQCKMEDVRQLKVEQLFQLQQQLAKASNTVMMALQTKCAPNT